MTEVILLVVILIIVVMLAVANLIFFAHELGWFPHGKRRDVPTERRTQITSGRIPEPEILRKNNFDFRAYSAYSKPLKYFAHKKIYDVKIPVEHLKNYLLKYQKEPSISNRDDLIDVVNHLTQTGVTNKELNDLIDNSIKQIIQIENKRTKGGSE